jgi:hypothetical protein
VRYFHKPEMKFSIGKLVVKISKSLKIYKKKTSQNLAYQILYNTSTTIFPQILGHGVETHILGFKPGCIKEDFGQRGCYAVIPPKSRLK